MATFAELHTKMMNSKFKEAVYRQLQDYIDENFKSIAGQPPKKVLLADGKLPVPAEIFEEIAVELNAKSLAAVTEVNQIMQSSVVNKQE